MTQLAEEILSSGKGWTVMGRPRKNEELIEYLAADRRWTKRALEAVIVLQQALILEEEEPWQ